MHGDFSTSGFSDALTILGAAGIVISRAIAPKTQWRPGEAEANAAQLSAAAATHA